MVYPGAVHSRFEHSLGVYWLAGKAVEYIKKHQVGTCPYAVISFWMLLLRILSLSKPHPCRAWSLVLSVQILKQ
jgi:hypothetical protein